MISILSAIIVATAAFGMLLRAGIADEASLLMSITWTSFLIISRAGSVDKPITKQISIVALAFTLAIALSIKNGIPISTSTMGFWQIWRGHAALIIGIILIKYSRTIPNWPISFLLNSNLLLSLAQPLLGEKIMMLFYPAGLMEYRSGILRSVGFFANPGTNAFFLGLLLLKTWSELLENPRSKKSKAMLAVTFLGLFTTGSRTTILTCPLLMIAMAIMHGSENSRTSKTKGYRFKKIFQLMHSPQ